VVFKCSEIWRTLKQCPIVYIPPEVNLKKALQSLSSMTADT